MYGRIGCRAVRPYFTVVVLNLAHGRIKVDLDLHGHDCVQDRVLNLFYCTRVLTAVRPYLPCRTFYSW